ncbi:unnamed protein product, partial [Meganyctiphanes norvegica]
MSGCELSRSPVLQLQSRFFPTRVSMGVLSEARKDECGAGQQQGKGSSSQAGVENYACYRLAGGAAAAAAGGAGLLGPQLYGVVGQVNAQQNIKWPVECQVLQDKIQHICDWPIYPEPFYDQSGCELRPQPVGDELGRIVYQYYPTSSVNYFSRSCLGGNKYLNDEVHPPLDGAEDNTLQFESRFECANLGKAVQVSECYYELHLRADLYTARHTQWFYFAVSNTRKNITYRFSIVNLSKGDSLYNHGMRPLMYSTKEAEIHNIGWRRCATNIVYYRNNDGNDSGCYEDDDEDAEDEAPSYTLTFNITFPHDNDTVYITHCYPYSYSDLQEHLLTIQNDPYKSLICRQRILCRSLAGNPIYLLTITSHDPDEEGKVKRAIVLTARVHPGETPASWMMKGVLDFLTSEQHKAQEFRKQFIFISIPSMSTDRLLSAEPRCLVSNKMLLLPWPMRLSVGYDFVGHLEKAFHLTHLNDRGSVPTMSRFLSPSRNHS